MGVRVGVSLNCSTTGASFGPVFGDAAKAEDFLEWYNERGGQDLREMDDDELTRLVYEWRAKR